MRHLRRGPRPAPPLKLAKPARLVAVAQALLGSPILVPLGFAKTDGITRPVRATCFRQDSAFTVLASRRSKYVENMAPLWGDTATR